MTSVPTLRGVISSFQAFHLFILPSLSLFPEKGPCDKVGLSSVSPFVSLCPLSLCLTVSVGPSPAGELRSWVHSSGPHGGQCPCPQPVSWEFQLIWSKGPAPLLSQPGRPVPRQLPALAPLPVYFGAGWGLRVCGPERARPREGLSPHQPR